MITHNQAMDQWSELVRAHLPLCEASAAASAMVHGALLLDQQLDQLAEDDDDDDDDGMGGTGLIQHTSELPALGERKEWCYAKIAELAQQNDVGDPAASRSDALAALVQVRGVWLLGWRQQLVLIPSWWKLTVSRPTTPAEPAQQQVSVLQAL